MRCPRVKNAARRYPMPIGGARVPDDSKPAARPALTPQSGASPIVRLPAEIDIANAGQVLADLLGVIDRGYPVVVADLSRTSFCDCSGVSALLTAGSHAARRGGQLRIVARARAVLRTFELTGLQLALPVYPAGAAAIKEPGSAAAGPGLAGTAPARSAAVTTVNRRRTDAAGSGPQPGPPRCP